MNILGLDKSVLATLKPAERKSYAIAEYLFYGIILLIAVGDAYAGYFFNGSWLAVIISFLCLGFIHFSVYRLALITLTTRPLSTETTPTTFKIGSKTIKISSYFDVSFFLRAIFIGCISLSVAMLLDLGLHYKEVEAIQVQQRIDLLRSGTTLSMGVVVNDNTRFPFFVIQKFLEQGDFKLLLLLLFVALQSPAIYLAYLRHSGKFEYAKKIAEMHKVIVMADYNKNIKLAQSELNKRFPSRYNLAKMSVYTDPPFNTKFKREKSAIGSGAELSDFLKSV